MTKRLLSKNSKKVNTIAYISILVLFLILILVIYIVNNGFKFNLNKYAKITDQICIPNEDKQTKPCTDGTLNTRSCNSDGLSWGPWQGCNTILNTDTAFRAVCCNDSNDMCVYQNNKLVSTITCTYGCKTLTGGGGKCKYQPVVTVTNTFTRCVDTTHFSTTIYYSNGTSKIIPSSECPTNTTCKTNSGRCS